jgi:hypothetical protein
MQGEGFLAIWSDVDAAQETDYFHWLTREHTAERMGVEGFVAVRVFRVLDSAFCRVLILYELETAEALAGPSYLARLNAPTPWSQRIMPILQNFVRGGGRRVLSLGTGSGGYVAASVFADAVADTAALAAGLIARDRIAAVHLLETDQARTAIKTNEKALRPQDQSFHSLLLVEGLDQASIRLALAACPAALPAGMTATAMPLYAQIFALDRRSLSA